MRYAALKRFLNKLDSRYKWGVGLVDYPMGMELNGDYYSTRFKTKEEAQRWCDHQNNLERDDGCYWSVRKRKGTEDNTEPSIDPWRGDKPLGFHNA